MSPQRAKQDTPHDYTMKIERTIVDKLGLQMYDKASAVVAELVANSYDADAEKVTLSIPLGKALAVRTKDGVQEKGYVIEVKDDGHGMTPDEANEFYLKVGIDRRKNPKHGGLSREKGRRVMGRKGIGKLAPFGICRTIEVWSAGGPNTNKGYVVTHFELDYERIINYAETESDDDYHPRPLPEDKTWTEKRGTRITLKNFYPKRVPAQETFHRQLAVRFGLELSDFGIFVINNSEEGGRQFQIGKWPIPLMDVTRISVNDRPVVCDGKKYPVSGWVGLAREPYKNVELAGIRIYARGKIASVTRDFGISSGFPGEFVARSYLVGEIFADWLDEEDDLIQTHRQDIQWSSDLGQAFSQWGQTLLKEVAKKGRLPRREKARVQFMRISQLREKAKERFPDSDLQNAALEVGAKIGQFASEEELTDEDYVADLTELILTIAPHKLLVDTFKKINEIAIDGKVAVPDLLKLFRTTRIAELASYGQIVAEKLKTIDVFERAIRQEDTDERELQHMLESAPWLINPRWELSVADRSLKTFQESFEGWYEQNYGEEITTTTQITAKTRRPDFIFLDKDDTLIIVEIKPPKHTFDDEDWERLERYYDAIEKFLNDNPAFREAFPKGHKVILVRDSENVNSTVVKAMDGLKAKGRLQVFRWEEMVKNTKSDHEMFLTARDQLRLY